ncbi:hypothetical protein [Catenuloplanes indicus]|uniref:Secreted protein n=1 Tax=Catenuloplanes indicus TaxID=137267 RepID=A0AAE4AZL0_9ACTN|nr:hypothetical protein [Catenuloplanes indicus]MDQ0366063.1 hypothetical protein [Catenuloplanes indicus]
MTSRRNTARNAALAAGVCLATIFGAASPAMADTSNAYAQALSTTLVGGVLGARTTPAQVANDGTQPVQTSTGNPTLIGGQSILKAGVLVQQATAWPEGRDAACAGVAGNGGVVAIGNDGTCTVSGSGGVSLELLNVLGLGSVTLKADAITSECYATSLGDLRAKSTLANLRLETKTALGTTTTTSLAGQTGPNTGVNVGGLLGLGNIATLLINEQHTDATNNSASATALRIGLLGTTGVLSSTVEVGKVMCGETKYTPALPVHGLPIAGGALAVAMWFGRHRIKSLATSLRGAR